MARRTGKAPSKRRSGRQDTRLGVDVKINILHTIADAIYATPAGKIREAVANSRDKGADWVLIAVDQTNRRLSIFDNGRGITRERFQEIFDSIGYGRLRDSDDPKMSYFGLGLMSIFQLGNRVEVFTQPRDQEEIIQLGIDTRAIFDKRNKDESIQQLGQFLTPLTGVSEDDRRRASLGLVNRAFSSAEPIVMPESFTEILIEDIPPDVIEEIGQPEFRVELMQILPLRPAADEPFLDRFTGKKGQQVAQLLRDPEYCSTVDVYFGIQEALDDGESIPQIWKYFPKFKSSLRFSDDTVYVGTGQDGQYAYYALHTMGENLQGEAHEDGNVAARRDRETEDETGFWIRNQNFLVKSADFLDRPGPGRRPAGTVDKPLRKWVFGEVFHKDMNPFLRVGRNEFIWEDKEGEFREFRDDFLRNVSGPLNQATRTVWDKRKPVMDKFIRPIEAIADHSGPFARTQNRLRLMIGEGQPEHEFWENAKDLIAGRRCPDIEDEDARVDAILRKKKQPILLAEDENAVVRVVPAMPESAGMYHLDWDAASERVLVDVSPALFKPRRVVFLGETFEIVLVAKRGSDGGVSVSLADHRIYVNPFNGDLCEFSVSILDVYIALEVADAISKRKDDLKRNFLRLLGATSSGTQKYLGPLGDDLRRTATYRR